MLTCGVLDDNAKRPLDFERAFGMSSART